MTTNDLRLTIDTQLLRRMARDHSTATIRELLEWTCPDCGGDMRETGYIDRNDGMPGDPCITHVCKGCLAVEAAAQMTAERAAYPLTSASFNDAGGWPISQDEADELIQASAYAEMVDDSEPNKDGFVYTLDDGTTVVVTHDGDLLAVEPE